MHLFPEINKGKEEVNKRVIGLSVHLSMCYLGLDITGKVICRNKKVSRNKGKEYLLDQGSATIRCPFTRIRHLTH